MPDPKQILDQGLFHCKTRLTACHGLHVGRAQQTLAIIGKPTIVRHKANPKLKYNAKCRRDSLPSAVPVCCAALRAVLLQEQNNIATRRPVPSDGIRGEAVRIHDSNVCAGIEKLLHHVLPAHACCPV